MKKLLFPLVYTSFIILTVLTFQSCAGSGETTLVQPITDATTQDTTTTTDDAPLDLSSSENVTEEGVDTVYTEIPEPEQAIVVVAPSDTLIELTPESPTEEVSDFNNDAMLRENEALREENELLKGRVSNLEKDISILESNTSILNKEPIKRQQQSSPKVNDESTADILAITTESENKIYPTEAITKSPIMSGKSSPEEISAYKSSLEILKQGNYVAAADQLQSLLSGGLKADLADNVYYWLGESSFGQKKYDEALSNFKQVSNYKISEKKDDAQYMVARCYERLGKSQQAVTEYKKLIESYPTSEFVKRAQARLR